MNKRVCCAGLGRQGARRRGAASAGGPHVKVSATWLLRVGLPMRCSCVHTSSNTSRDLRPTATGKIRRSASWSAVGRPPPQWCREALGAGPPPHSHAHSSSRLYKLMIGYPCSLVTGLSVSMVKGCSTGFSLRRERLRCLGTWGSGWSSASWPPDEARTTRAPRRPLGALQRPARAAGAGRRLLCMMCKVIERDEYNVHDQ